MEIPSTHSSFFAPSVAPPRLTAKRLRQWRLLALGLALLGLGACSTARVDQALAGNSPESLYLQQARQEARQKPTPLVRPVLVLGGFGDVGVASETIAEIIRETTGDRRVYPIAFGTDQSFQAMRQRVMRVLVDNGLVDTQGRALTVDVVAFSMGGVVARYSALNTDAAHAMHDAVDVRPSTPDEIIDGRPDHLHIHRLFTIATPHRGALLAENLPAFSQVHRDLRPGSPLIQKISAVQTDYPIIPFVREGDIVVGVEQAAPQGQSPILVETDAFEVPHGQAFNDPEILAPIIQSLRQDASLPTVP